MAINRELSQFGRLVEITDGEHIGIGTTSSVNIGFGTITATTVTATSFYGDGSNLTGVSGGGIGTDGSVNTTGIITASSFSGDGSGLTNLPLNLSLSVTTRTGITTVSVVAGFFTAFGRTSNTSISVTV
jgi:hypothetical protein